MSCVQNFKHLFSISLALEQQQEGGAGVVSVLCVFGQSGKCLCAECTGLQMLRAPSARFWAGVDLTGWGGNGVKLYPHPEAIP